jgi:hypothetical protein
MRRRRRRRDVTCCACCAPPYNTHKAAWYSFTYLLSSCPVFRLSRLSKRGGTRKRPSAPPTEPKSKKAKRGSTAGLCCSSADARRARPQRPRAPRQGLSCDPSALFGASMKSLLLARGCGSSRKNKGFSTLTPASPFLAQHSPSRSPNPPRPHARRDHEGPLAPDPSADAFAQVSFLPACRPAARPLSPFRPANPPLPPAAALKTKTKQNRKPPASSCAA